jgi:archaellum component FlaD/FlaE
MAVNQSQVDHIITAASEDDPEVKLQNLEREVDLIKTSIKRLLMDIRERMNELENPFTLAAPGTAGAPAGPSAAVTEAEEAQRSALEAREAALEARESRLEAAKTKLETDNKKEVAPNKTEPVNPVDDSRKMLDEQVLAILRSQAGSPQKTVFTSPAPAAPANERRRLQKVYKLFKWTNQAVKKVGHDRLEIILESYRAMGYITKESCDEIREISRLMPANLGEEHEVGPDEFVSELYTLNRILSPDDTSLDRDMIEVMMEQRQNMPGSMVRSGEESLELPRVSLIEKKSPMHKEKDEEWMNLPDRI